MSLVWGKVDPLLLMRSFRQDIEDLIGPSKYEWHISYGFRSLEQQKVLYEHYMEDTKHNPRAAPPGKSAHNYGMAVDLWPDDPDKAGTQPMWKTNTPAWIWLLAKVKLHPRLKSGVNFNDAGHIERYKWLNYI